MKSMGDPSNAEIFPGLAPNESGQEEGFQHRAPVGNGALFNRGAHAGTDDCLFGQLLK